MKRLSPESLAPVAQYLVQRREAILVRWRQEVDADDGVNTVAQLTRTEFRDHMPNVLTALEARLRDWPREDSHDEREEYLAGEHGAHRWQQGYDLNEMAHEWSLMNLVLVEELDAYGILHPEAQASLLPQARTVLAHFVGAGISGSITEFYHLQRMAAEARALELELALGNVQQSQRQRGELLREASHDLRGGLSVVKSAASLLEWERLPQEKRAEALKYLQSGVESVERLLTDVLDLARLEAGRETRKVAPFDAAKALQQLCENTRPLADARGLWLKTIGPDTLRVRGDENKVVRIAQNLILNALRYTVSGGVTVTWQVCSDTRWMLSIRDTGPGLKQNSPLAREMGIATQQARDVGALSSETGSDAGSQENARAEPGPPPASLSDQARDGDSTADEPAEGTPERATISGGEGIGLSIVKKLCELLDAPIELDSDENGSEFRVVFPGSYSN